jgi:hypothetical protein
VRRNGMGNYNNKTETFLTLETNSKIKLKPCLLSVLQIICKRRDHKISKNMTMLVYGEGVILHQRQRDNQDRGESKAKGQVIEVSNQVDFIFFFIWQAIVRGQLFLQKTFFFLAIPQSAIWLRAITTKATRYSFTIDHSPFTIQPPLLLSSRFYTPDRISRIIRHQHIVIGKCHTHRPTVYFFVIFVSYKT